MINKQKENERIEENQRRDVIEMQKMDQRLLRMQELRLKTLKRLVLNL